MTHARGGHAIPQMRARVTPDANIECDWSSYHGRRTMALTATIHNFDIELADVDRHVYDTIAMRVARHPSESEEYLVTRILAYCLEYADGIAFSNGISDPDEPTISVRDLTGAVKVWIEIGAPDAARVHKASKASPRVAIYSHRDVDQLLAQWAGERIHRAEAVELYRVDRAFIGAFAARLERRMALALSRTDGHLYLTMSGAVIEGAVVRVPL
jgi:uncharacterized protein YaeQ